MSVESGFVEPPDPNFNPHDYDSPGWKSFSAGLNERLVEFGDRAAKIPAGAYGSAEWAERAGGFLWEMRKQQRVPRTSVAEKIGVDSNVLLFLELGVGRFREYTGNLPERYAEAIGNPGVYSSYNLIYKIEWNENHPANVQPHLPKQAKPPSIVARIRQHLPF
ncbi:hypothetical protein A2858_02230 [Candidatus Daviesbacteria bacterium RIFCSPHIGHO2_01_FULL_36_37]|uniref:Uncharacterized protein n=1 Tax=Candidatus Daviesbacteria bacterium RIFCSPHIGHO2_01_FULL_36_37 TaxID=1797758 RepID=A0A1F5IJY9_9BACT|nr:MAG: hypothetical protein A2858_02230 [Candidatus Daviesbacteria bacterium RIFCSPHIGHO2_01_FULL_36_37]